MKAFALQHLARGHHETQPHQRHGADHQQGADHGQPDQQDGQRHVQAEQSDELQGLTPADLPSLLQPDIALRRLDDAEFHAEVA